MITVGPGTPTMPNRTVQGLGCRMLNFSKGDPMPTGLPDPLDTLGSSWVRIS